MRPSTWDCLEKELWIDFLFAILVARSMRTLLLTRSETEVLLELDSLLADLRAAFRGYSLDRSVRKRLLN